MRTQSRTLVDVLLALCVAVTGCGGSSPPATSPPSPTETSGAAPADSAAKTGGDTNAPGASPAPAEAASPSSGGSSAPSAASAARSNREPREILELKDTVFFLSFDESDAKKTAEANCAKQGNDPKKTNACMSKARQDFEGEGHRFEQDKSGDWWWFVVRRKGNVLTNIHKVRYQYGEQTDTAVVIKPEGKDEGTQRWGKVPSEVKIEVPSEYRIVLHDPAKGKMVYEAKAILGGGK